MKNMVDLLFTLGDRKMKGYFLLLKKLSGSKLILAVWDIFRDCQTASK